VSIASFFKGLFGGAAVGNVVNNAGEKKRQRERQEREAERERSGIGLGDRGGAGFDPGLDESEADPYYDPALEPDVFSDSDPGPYLDPGGSTSARDSSEPYFDPGDIDGDFEDDFYNDFDEDF